MSWARQQLRHVADVSVSNVDKKSVEGERPVRLVNYTDVYYGDRISPDQDLMGATATLSQVAAFSLRPGDVLITKDSETADDIGVAAYVEETDASMVLGYHLALLRPDPSELDGRYLYWVVCGDDAIGQLSVTATGVTRFGLRSDAIKGLSLAIPPLPEQQAIADYLDAETARIDALITKKRHMIDLASERLQAQIEEKIAESGGDYAVLGRACTDLAQGESPQAGGRPAAPGELGILKLSAVRRGEYRPNENKVLDSGYVSTKSIVPAAGDLLVTRANTPELVGDVCAVTNPEPSVILCDLIYRLKLNPTILESEFAAYSLLTWKARAHLSGSARGTSQSMVKVRGEDIRSCPIQLPSLSIQRRAVLDLNRAGSTRSETVGNLLRQSELLAERRQALITAAVTGELEIPGVAA